MIIFETFNCFLDFFNLKFFQRNDRKVVPFFVDGATLMAGIWILSYTLCQLLQRVFNILDTLWQIIREYWHSDKYVLF
jgi:hypothetical protein